MTRVAPRRSTDRSETAWIGRAATVALHDELALYPKPGLVSFVDTGSHDDMDGRTFMRSLFALRGTFVRMAALGAAEAPFDALEREGIAAERRMLVATGGVNTHRGAIFSLGLLCAATAATGGGVTADGVRATLVDRWQPALRARRSRLRASHGREVARRWSLRTVEEEAADGFPILFETALPALTSALDRGLDPRRAKLQAFFAVLAVLDDTNLAHRGGMAGLRAAREMTRDFLERGGADAGDAIERATAVHRAFVERRLSPGGTADVLAAACFLRRVTTAV